MVQMHAPVYGYKGKYLFLVIPTFTSHFPHKQINFIFCLISGKALTLSHLT